MSVVRLQKFLAECGVASRRSCEKLIYDGQVAVNGKVVKELGTKIDPARDAVRVDGAEVRLKKKLYLALNKPRGYICTKRDPEGRMIISELLPPEWANLAPVGRLDKDSEGLIFLSNDGDFSLRLTHPRYGIKKIYEVRVAGKVALPDTQKILQGVRDEGDFLKADRVRIMSANNSHSFLEIELSEGRNREIRRMLGALGFEVDFLRRVQIGKIKLGELKPGRWRTLSGPEIKSLLPDKPQPGEVKR
ncbi:MAG TPA: pseudouridine synthase [Candidatus Limnocylindria bacterium]|nr:pseudouridine synthase [Candidatus Limnocylindria bacterium]